MARKSYSWNPTPEKLDAAFTFIAGHIRQMGYAPTIREIAAGMGGCSTKTASEAVRVLEEQGRITRSLNPRTREIRLVEVPT